WNPFFEVPVLKNPFHRFFVRRSFSSERSRGIEFLFSASRGRDGIVNPDVARTGIECERLLGIARMNVGEIADSTEVMYGDSGLGFREAARENRMHQGKQGGALSSRAHV